jgi:putative transposase
MPNTYSKIYLHLIFVVKWRKNLISDRWKNELYKYICGIIKNKGQKPLAINGMPDHVHIVINIQPDVSICNLVRDIKSNSSRFINENNFCKERFEWQTGYAAFSVGHPQLDTAIKYVINQEIHHQTKTFKTELLDIYRMNEIEFDNRYLFDFMPAPGAHIKGAE